MAKYNKGETISLIRPEARFKVNYIKPCAEEGKKIANAQILLENPIDVEKLFEVFSKYSNMGFKNIKAVKKLNLVNFDFNDKSITFFSKGKVVVRKAKNEKDVIKTIETISNILKQF
jgi:ArsR family metal-binding transcriptional regulator